MSGARVNMCEEFSSCVPIVPGRVQRRTTVARNLSRPAVYFGQERAIKKFAIFFFLIFERDFLLMIN